MGTFRQLGDPVCPPALCQHHEAVYAEIAGLTPAAPIANNYTSFAHAATITQVQIVITERCCVNVNAAMISYATYLPTDFEIEQPVWTIKTQQESRVISSAVALFHHAAWEVLDPGTYVYSLINRSGSARLVIAAWIKAIASDCEA